VCQAWEYFHKGLGYSAVIIAFATIYTGLQTVAPDASDAVKGLYAAWIAITLACFGLLQLWWWRWGKAAYAARNAAPTAKATSLSGVSPGTISPAPKSKDVEAAAVVVA
jgi:hypothetical protein